VQLELDLILHISNPFIYSEASLGQKVKKQIPREHTQRQEEEFNKKFENASYKI